jgi:hypothetical protein
MTEDKEYKLTVHPKVWTDCADAAKKIISNNQTFTDPENCSISMAGFRNQKNKTGSEVWTK